MTTSVIGFLTLLVAGCASQPPTKPTALDPSNPAAPEAPPAAVTPLMGTGATSSSGPQASEPAAAAMPSGHEHGEGAATPSAPDDAKAAISASPSPAGGHEHAKEAGATKAAVTYTCPMHPEISMPKPGKCPKCGMKLVSRKANAAPSDDAAPTSSPGAGHADGKDPGRAKAAVTYTCPMHPEISMPKPGKCPKCGMKLVPRRPGGTPSEQK